MAFGQSLEEAYPKAFGFGSVGSRLRSLISAEANQCSCLSLELACQGIEDALRELIRDELARCNLLTRTSVDD